MNPPLFRHLLPLAVALALGGPAHGAITYVDPADIVIPSTFGGVYLKFQTEATSGSTAGGSAAADSYTISFSEPTDWDVNFFFGGAFIVHSLTFQPYRSEAGNKLSAIDRLGLNTVIDGNPINPAPTTGPSSPLSSADFGASGTTTGGDIYGNQTPTHMGSAADQFARGGGSEGYIGFVLNPGASQLYGWIRVTLADDGSTGLIHDWAYSDTAIAVGQIPEPAAALLGGLGLLTLRRRRR